MTTTGSMLQALAVALLAGAAIAGQVTTNHAVGRVIGVVKAGLLVNAASGMLAAVVIGGWVAARGATGWTLSGPVLSGSLLSGALGVGIVIGIVFAVGRVGVAAALATVFLGQMALGVAMDALGWSGMHAAPVDLRRIAGLLLTCGGIALLLPRG